MQTTPPPAQTASDASMPVVGRRFRINSFGLRLFLVIMGGALTGIGGMAFLFGEKVKYQAEDQIKSTLNSKVSTIHEVTDQAENLAYGLNVSVSTLYIRRAETPGTYRELTRQLFQGRPEFVTGLGFGQKQYGVLSEREWFFPYYQTSTETATSLPQSSAPETGQLTQTQPPEPRPEGRYTDQAEPAYFYPETDRYRDYFLPQANLWTTPYQRDRKLLLSYYSQIFDNQGVWLGTAVVDIDGTYLSTVLDEPVLRQGGQLMLLTKTGDVIANPADPDALGTQTYEDIPELSALWAQMGASDPAGFIEGETGYWAYTQIPEREWLMVAYVPYRVVFGQVMLITLGASTAVGLLLAGVVALAIRYLNRRLRPVLEECHRLSEVDDEMLKQLNNKDELEQLSISFFNLLEQLQLSQTRFRQEVVHSKEVEDQLKQAGAKVATNQMRQQEEAQKLADVETQLKAMTAQAETSQMRQQEEAQKLADVEAQLKAMTAQAETSQMRQQEVVQRLTEKLGADPQKPPQEVAHLSEVVSVLATEDLAVAESADRDEPDPVVAALNLLSHRLGSTFAQVLSVLNQVAQLRPTFTQVTQQMQAIEQGVMTTANAAHEQTTLVAEVQQWIEMTDDLSQVLAQQALTANKAGNTATAALITGQQKMISIASEVEGFRDKSLQLTERIQGMLESIDSATQTTREHQRTANIARVLLLNASTLSIRASQKQQPEDFESLVNQFQGVSTQLQQLTEQFNQSLKQQQNQTRQAQFVVANLRRDIQSFNQSMGGFKSSIETSQSALSQSQSATQKITEAGQQMTDLSQQLAELVHTSRQTLQDMAEIARSTQNRTDLTLQQTQAVERLTQEMATMTAGFLASEG